MKKLIIAVIASILVACGGGDEISNTEGFYEASYSDGAEAWALVDSNRNIWITRGYEQNRLKHWWTSIGNIAVEDSFTFKGSGYDTALQAPMTFSATKIENGAFALDYNIGKISKLGVFKQKSKYIFDAPLTIKRGQYYGFYNIQTPYESAYLSIQLTLDSKNSFLGNTYRGCTFSGNLTNTGKAYQLISVKFNGGSCEYGTSTMTGVLFDLNENSLKVILKNNNNVMIVLFAKSTL